MQLEHLCEMTLAYRSEELYDGFFAAISPYGTDEATIYGEGNIAFRGDRFQAHGRWVNYARRRSDGVNLPGVRGVVRTSDGSTVLFRMEGRTLPATAEGNRKQVLTLLFETDAASYLWMNSSVCVLEGVIDAASGEMRGRVAVCVHELD